MSQYKHNLILRRFIKNHDMIITFPANYTIKTAPNL